jgi:C4-type Zn-finger protein
MAEEQLELDCYHKAEEGEAKFTLLARDPTGPSMVRLWAAIREADYKQAVVEFSNLVTVAERHYEGDPTNETKIASALTIAEKMERWAQ